MQVKMQVKTWQTRRRQSMAGRCISVFTTGNYHSDWRSLKIILKINEDHRSSLKINEDHRSSLNIIKHLWKSLNIMNAGKNLVYKKKTNGHSVSVYMIGNYYRQLLKRHGSHPMSVYTINDLQLINKQQPTFLSAPSSSWLGYHLHHTQHSSS